MKHPAIDSKDPPSLEGGMLWMAGIVLALVEFRRGAQHDDR